MALQSKKKSMTCQSLPTKCDQNGFSPVFRARACICHFQNECNFTNAPNPLEGIFLNVQIGFLNTNLTQLPYYN